MAVVKYQTRLKEPRRGLCSSWLASLNPGQGKSIVLGLEESITSSACPPLFFLPLEFKPQ